MRRALLGFVSAGALTVASTAATSAADMAPVFKAPPAEPVYDWSGFYVGGHAGFGAGSGYSQFIIDVANEDLRANGPRGALWGVQAGYNHQVGRMVFGIEGDWSWLNAESSNAYTRATAPIATNFTTLELRSLASVRGRFGITANQLLLYATMGGAWMRGRYTVTDTDAVRVLGIPPIDRDLNSFGIAFGGGAEWALGNGFSLRAEYLRYSFGASAGPIDTTSVTNSRVASAKIDSVDVARVGVNYAFFKPAPAKAAPGTIPYWTGFYVGGHAGYAASSASTDLIHDVFVEDLKAEGPRGGIWGAQAGYNHQAGRVVYGIEGDWSWADLSRSNSRTIPGSTITSSVEHTLKMLASVRGRVGVTADQLLLYATAGWGYASMDFRAFDRIVAPAGVNVSGSLTANGLVYGGGAEWALGQGWSARAEYLHYAFAAADGPILTSVNGRVASKINSVDVVRAGLNYNLQQKPATPAATVAGNWTGFHVGAHAGYGMAASTAQFTRDVLVEKLRAESPHNGVFGAQIGYSRQIGRVVWGVEGDWSWFDASRSNSFSSTAPAVLPATVDQKIQWLASARARGGIAVDQLLLYGTVGWGWSKAEFSATDSSLPSISQRVQDSMIADGLVYGAGAEWNLGNGLSARAEYLHYAFGQNLGPYRLFPTSDTRKASYRVDAVDVVRAGLNYRFTGPVWPTAPMPR
ncbi:MAG: outer membrane beta-barrel protein [Xanthobacteraceae bacterium]|nr:outer membrane beta-barrel protein [Xanthobacteraceae bacterium]